MSVAAGLAPVVAPGNEPGSAPPACEIWSQGRRVDDVEVLSVETSDAINRIPRATIVIQPWDADTRSFAASDDARFAPGAVIDVRLGTLERVTSVLSGPVLRHRLSSNSGGARLTLELRHPAVALTRGRKYRIWTDSDHGRALRDVVAAANLKIGRVPTATWKHPQLVQYGCSNWDFLLERSEALGQVVVVDGNTVNLQPLEAAAEADLSLQYGISSVLAFDVEADASEQYASSVARSFDPDTQKFQSESGAEQQTASLGGWSPKKVGKDVGANELTLGDAVPRPKGEGKAWASAELELRRAGFLSGTVTVTGDSNVRVGQTLQLDGFGKGFSGLTLITGVEHVFAGSPGWDTVIQFGRPPSTMGAANRGAANDVAAPPAGGLVPPVSGLQIGVVDAIGTSQGEQPDLVRVVLPSLGPDVKAWARLALPGVGNARGVVFRPRAGDEVVVGFFSDDPRQPVVLGGMFSKKNTPPSDYAATENNDTWAIVSEKGCAVAIVDSEQPVLRVVTPAGNSIELSDEAKSLTVKDQHGNSVVLDQSGVAVKISGASVDLG